MKKKITTLNSVDELVISYRKILNLLGVSKAQRKIIHDTKKMYGSGNCGLRITIDIHRGFLQHRKSYSRRR